MHPAPSLVLMSTFPLFSLCEHNRMPVSSPPGDSPLYEHLPVQLSSLPEDSPIFLFSVHAASPMPLFVLELYAWPLPSSSLPWSIWYLVLSPHVCFPTYLESSGLHTFPGHSSRPLRWPACSQCQLSRCLRLRCNCFIETAP